MLSTAVLLAASMVVGQGGEKAKPGPDYQQLKAMEWMIGDWEAEYVVASPGLGLDGFPPGAKVHSFNSYYWMQNKNYIGFKFRDEIDGKVVHAGFEMIGVDPQSKKTIHWLFSIMGGWGPGEWMVEGKTWKLKWTGTTSDGTKYEGVSFMVPVDGNTHTWEMKECKKNGEPTAVVRLDAGQNRPDDGHGQIAALGRPQGLRIGQYVFGVRQSLGFQERHELDTTCSTRASQAQARRLTVPPAGFG